MEKAILNKKDPYCKFSIFQYKLNYKIKDYGIP